MYAVNSILYRILKEVAHEQNVTACTILHHTEIIIQFDIFYDETISSRTQRNLKTTMVS